MSVINMSTGLRNRMLGLSYNMIPTANGNGGAFSADVLNIAPSVATVTWINGAGANGTTGYCTVGTAAGYGNFPVIAGKLGRWYKLTYWFKRAGGGGNGYVKVGTTAGGSEYYSSGNLTDADWTKHEVKFLLPLTAADTDLYISMGCDDANAQQYDEIKLESDARSLQDIFYKGFINVYKGTMPASADSAHSAGDLLFTLYSDGTTTGLTFADAGSGAITKTLTETWSCSSAAAGGTATWGRLYCVGDALGTDSNGEIERVDFDISTAGAFLNMASTTIVAGATQAVSTFQFTLPA